MSESAARAPIGLRSAVALVVANIIGAGIFTTTGFQAADLGDPAGTLMLWESDGKATDCYRHTGRYGIAGVRHALREAARAGICVHALAEDAIARDTWPPIFGPGAWHVLPYPERLPEVLTTVYGRHAVG